MPKTPSALIGICATLLMTLALPMAQAEVIALADHPTSAQIKVVMVDDVRRADCVVYIADRIDQAEITAYVDGNASPGSRLKRIYRTQDRTQADASGCLQ